MPCAGRGECSNNGIRSISRGLRNAASAFRQRRENFMRKREVRTGVNVASRSRFTFQSFRITAAFCTCTRAGTRSRRAPRGPKMCSQKPPKASLMRRATKSHGGCPAVSICWMIFDHVPYVAERLSVRMIKAISLGDCRTPWASVVRARINRNSAETHVRFDMLGD